MGAITTVQQKWEKDLYQYIEQAKKNTFSSVQIGKKYEKIRAILVDVANILLNQVKQSAQCGQCSFSASLLLEGYKMQENLSRECQPVNPIFLKKKYFFALRALMKGQWGFECGLLDKHYLFKISWETLKPLDCISPTLTLIPSEIAKVQKPIDFYAFAKELRSQGYFDFFIQMHDNFGNILRYPLVKFLLLAECKRFKPADSSFVVNLLEIQKMKCDFNTLILFFEILQESPLERHIIDSFKNRKDILTQLVAFANYFQCDSIFATCSNLLLKYYKTALARAAIQDMQDQIVDLLKEIQECATFYSIPSLSQLVEWAKTDATWTLRPVV